MGSAEIAMTTDEMEAETDVKMDAEIGDVMDAKTTDETANGKDAQILDTETCVPLGQEKFLRIISILLAFA